jgi:hypothetical protein
MQMTDDVVAREITDFLIVHIDTVAQLEALLLLRANPDKRWDVESAARRLYINDREAQDVLGGLCNEGLISRDVNAYRYAPPAEKSKLVDRLAEAYARHLIPVTNIIHQKPGRIREFADAFKFKRGS